MYKLFADSHQGKAGASGYRLVTEELETADDARAADPGLAHVTDDAFW